jgi:hypothetical protein
MTTPHRKWHEMKRRTVDLALGISGAFLAVLALVLAMVLTSNANFAKDYVHDQLAEQKVFFKAAEKLSPTERAWTEARTGCLITYAEQQVTTGKQAECFANEYLGGHLRDPNRIANADGKTYAELGDVQSGLRAQIKTAEEAKDPAVADLKTKLADVTTARETVFKGEMLRGGLLTSYGFSDLGERARQAATVAFLGAGLLALLSIAMFVAALRSPKDELIAAPDSLERMLESAGR